MDVYNGKSNWDSCPSTAGDQPQKADRQYQWITEQIKWHEKNVSSLYDDMILIELDKLKKLHEKYIKHGDQMFADEIMESFRKIVDLQREKMADL